MYFPAPKRPIHMWAQFPALAKQKYTRLFKPIYRPYYSLTLFVITHSQLWGFFCCFQLSSSASHLPFGDYIWTIVSKNTVPLTLPHDARSQTSHSFPYDFKLESYSLTTWFWGCGWTLGWFHPSDAILSTLSDTVKDKVICRRAYQWLSTI